MIHLRSFSDLHEVVCDVLWLQAIDSVGGGLRHIDSEVSGLQPAEVCKQVSGLLVQGRGGTRQDLQREELKVRTTALLRSQKIPQKICVNFFVNIYTHTHTGIYTRRIGEVWG